MKRSLFTILFVSLLFFACTNSINISENNKKPGNQEQDQDENQNPEMETVLGDNWITFGLLSKVLDKDPIFSRWAQYGDALKDTHGTVIGLYTYNSNNNLIGKTTLRSSNINITEDTAITFDYRLDILGEDIFSVKVDGNVVFSTKGIWGEGWKKGSVILSKGFHTVDFVAENCDEYYYNLPCTNAVYLDNINIVPDTTEFVGIYPKGNQETFVNGNSIQFTANALRSDNSIRSDRDISWSCTGGTITQNGLFTPGSTAGIYKVTATIDGKEASNSTVIVHGENYLEDSVTINGNTFTGYSGSTTSFNTDTISFEIAPSGSSFEADGFFVVKGKVTNEQTNNYAILVIKCGDYETTYLLKDEFYERIWLRFGNADEYEIRICDITEIFFMGECYTGCNYSWSNTWTVTNTSPISTEEAVYLLPSYFCQGDNYLVSNTINAILAELPQDASVGQKLQALHDWQIHALHYDNASLNPDNRKLQDAVSVLKNNFGVCEGYANLYACFARAIGVKTRYQASSRMNHGWVQCYYNNEWKLVDVTWDDPIHCEEESCSEKYPYAENYNYFLIKTTGLVDQNGNYDHYGDETDYTRSIVEYTQPKRLYGPDGWY